MHVRAAFTSNVKYNWQVRCLKAHAALHSTAMQT